MSALGKAGGPAFPMTVTEHVGPDGQPLTAAFYHGMTLRDWFAGQALAGYASTLGAVEVVRWERLADDAYRAADAMLAARGAGQ